MKVVGLLSGGKDSCFNLCHCVKQGHEVVALASLRPEGGKEEIDSYLYQTVGQDGLHFIAEALELPLYRRVIHGTAVDQESDYASTSAARLQGRVEGDETEDLYDLLTEVLAVHPDVKGVSVGAILSNYQRVRVEHVCARLGLQSLSYLWQYDQTQLLEDMAEAGMECIIIKVAGAGLGLRHLGQNVCSPEMRTTMESLKNMWGTHPAGEGGEYETFTLDCPLFKKRIDLIKTEQVVLSDSDPRHDIGTVAYLRIQEARLVPSSKSTEPLSSVPVPSLLDDEAQELYKALIGFDVDIGRSNANHVPSVSSTSNISEEISSSTSGPWISIGNLTSRRKSPEAQAKECFQLLKDRLQDHKLDFRHIAHINLYLSSMDLFLPINAVYNSFFGPSPPTRACVACPFPLGCHVKMDVLAYQQEPFENARSALHVRGLSYWAPANIGPYSQAVRVGQRLFVAGQIGLIPATLSLPSPPSFAMEAALSSQHERRIVRAVQEGTGGGFDARMETCICWVSGPPPSFQAKVQAVRAAWKVWMANSPNSKNAEVPLLIVQVPNLPKGAQIEWQMTWHAESSSSELDDDDIEFEPHSQRSAWSNTTESYRAHSWCSKSATVSITTLSGQKVDGSTSCQQANGAAFAIRAFHRESISADAAKAKYFGSSRASVTTVPVQSLATDEVDIVDMAFVAVEERT